MKSIIYFFIAAAGWFIISTVLLCLPGSKFPKEDWLNAIWFDKWVHIGLFAIMVVLWCGVIEKKWPFYIKNKNRFLLIGLLAFAYGIAMEFVQQYYIPQRSFDKWDILADGIGSLLGLLFSLQFFIKKKPL